MLSFGKLPNSKLRTGLLIHDDDLDLSPVINGLKIESSIAITNLETISPWSYAKSVQTFVNSLIEDVSTRYKDKIGLVNFISNPDEIVSWYLENKIEQIVVAYAATGPNASLIKKLIDQGLNVIQISKNYDQSAWPHATHGFFRFKEKIPALISELGLNS
jgi:deoxyribodipyrimidine photo-lyase